MSRLPATAAANVSVTRTAEQRVTDEGSLSDLDEVGRHLESGPGWRMVAGLVELRNPLLLDDWRRLLRLGWQRGQRRRRLILSLSKDERFCHEQERAMQLGMIGLGRMGAGMV